MAHEWIINKDKYEGRPRWYTCPICRYTYDNNIDHVSETNYCPNCQNTIGGNDKRLYKPFEHFSLPVMTFEGVNIVNKIHVQLIDMQEKAIHDAIIKEGLAQGFDELFLMDKKFVFDAIREKMQREGLL